MKPHDYEQSPTSYGVAADDRDPDFSGPDDPGIIEEGYMQFLSDLDELLGDSRNRGKLAAYHGKRKICVAADMKDILKASARENIAVEELMIESIVPQPDASQHQLDSSTEYDHHPLDYEVNV
jgi:hypothetical protein